MISPAPAHITLYDLYCETLTRLGRTPDTLPQHLFFTFCGDILGSSGPHCKKGRKTGFENALKRAARNCSDDVMQSLAMYEMRESAYSTELPDLIKAQTAFREILAPHYNRQPEDYSPWFRKPVSKETFLKDIAEHASCGAAMRAGILGATRTPREKALPLLLCTHAHPEAIEGAFRVYGMIKHLTETEDRKTGLISLPDAAGADTNWAYDQTCAFLKTNGAKIPPPSAEKTRPSILIKNADIYAQITDIETEGTQTRFVVPAALMILQRALSMDTKSAVRHIACESLRVGGDPDTICSIAMGLFGAFRPDETRETLSAIRLTIREQKG